MTAKDLNTPTLSNVKQISSFDILVEDRKSARSPMCRVALHAQFCFPIGLS